MRNNVKNLCDVL